MSASFCWVCGRPFPKHAKLENAQYVTDQLGNVHRVHVNGCHAAAIESVIAHTAEEKVEPMKRYFD